MFQDKDEELKRLEEELLAEEEDPQEQDDPEDASDFPPEEEPVMIAPGKVYNTDVLDTDLEAFSREVSEPRSRAGTTGLAILAIFLTAGIVCGVIFWILRLRGIL